jgi:Ankyrin repeats (3 copies)
MTSQEPDAVDAALLERYRQASSAEGLKPTEAVRAAILAEGRRIAEQRAAAPPLRSFDTSRPAANQSRFRLAAFGTFGVAILAALLIVPRWLISPASRPQIAQTRSASSSARDAAALREATAPKENAPVAGAPLTSAAPAPAEAPRLAKSETSSAAESREVTAGAAAKRPTQSTTNQIVQPLSENPHADQLAENAPPVAGGVPADSSIFGYAKSDADSAARTAQNRSLSASAGARPAAAPPPAASSSQTPLMAAVIAGDLRHAAMLLDRHASAEDRDGLGRTPLLVATAEGRVEIVRLLLAHGADPNATDKTGSTPLQLANRSQFTEIAQLLEDAGAH